MSDAKLIAAAPELFEALIASVKSLERAHMAFSGDEAAAIYRVIEQSIAAIKKARGES